MTELKPCPFCGGIGKILTIKKSIKGKERKYKYLSYVRCRHCFAKSDVKDNEREAISAWNRRAK